MSTLLQAQAVLQEERRTYEFDPKALEVLILKDLNLSPTDAKVEFLVGTEWRGYGPGEHQVAAFKGVRVTASRAVTPAPAPYAGGMYGDH